jgi:hypothetical protein
MKRRVIDRVVIALLFVALCFVFAVRVSRPPAAVPASAPATAFSAERAMRYVLAIAQRPHPIGSAEHDRVRDYRTFPSRACAWNGLRNYHVRATIRFGWSLTSGITLPYSGLSMEIRFVHKNHCFGRSFGYGIAHFIFRRNAGRWIIRVANID